MINTAAAALDFDYLIYLQAKRQQYPSATLTMPVLTENAPFELKKLPLEVRLMIWEATFPETRIHGAAVRGSWRRSFTIRIEPFPLPIVFQICRESREFAQKRFKRFAIDGHTELTDYSVPYGYCNPKIDALYLPREALVTGFALKFRPFRRIAIAICLHGSLRALIPRPNSNFTTETSDNRLQICFVMEEYILPPQEHVLCDSVRPVGFPEPKLLSQDEYRFYGGMRSWISEMERCVGDGYGPIVTVGDMPPVSCACPDRFEEVKRAFEAKRNEEARLARRIQKRANAQEGGDIRRRGVEQPPPGVHSMTLRPRIR